MAIKELIANSALVKGNVPVAELKSKRYPSEASVVDDDFDILSAENFMQTNKKVLHYMIEP